ncbi:hypothetical protein DdX_14763 [Ditylenchus destructor]|uniref:Uncharacterized protein n=1 Tax=Ditylenchus destructor TaxID=166010 RepID=A0AAD4MU26_9BILA|nr:hypothetical protein DdX_14763 [Ditylenchus destructor]
MFQGFGGQLFGKDNPSPTINDMLSLDLVPGLVLWNQAVSDYHAVGHVTENLLPPLLPPGKYKQAGEIEPELFNNIQQFVTVLGVHYVWLFSGEGEDEEVNSLITAGNTQARNSNLNSHWPS